jgi:hypothetical protein
VNQTKYIFIASLIASACTTSADASPFGPDHGFDAVYADVERAPEAPSRNDPDWLVDAFEHSINPESMVNDARSADFVQDETPQHQINHSTERSSHETPHRRSLPHRIR